MPFFPQGALINNKLSVQYLIFNLMKKNKINQGKIKIMLMSTLDCNFQLFQYTA